MISFNMLTSNDGLLNCNISIFTIQYLVFNALKGHYNNIEFILMKTLSK